MGPDRGWQPDSDDEYPSDRETDPVADSERLETIGNVSTTSSITSRRDQFDSLQKLMTLVHSATFRSILTTTFGVRDFAEIPSYQLARGDHFQTRKLAVNLGVAKYPVIFGSDGVSGMSYEAVALELQILLHEPVRKHRNVVDILSIGWTRLAPLKPPFLPIIYVEFALHGTLAQYLENNKIVGSAVKTSIMQDIARGLQVLHSCGITHGDLKMDNVLIFPRSDEPYSVQAKLSDFGCSVLEDEHGTQLRGCTPPWNAPEWHKKFSPSLLHVTDLYSLGLLVWCLTLNGKNPFEGQEADAIEARKLSDSVLEDAIQSIEQQYDTQMHLRGSIDDSGRFFTYLYGVAIPRRVLQNTLCDPLERNLQKVLESLSQEHYYG
jgi:serine/threonine protein kinase